MLYFCMSSFWITVLCVFDLEINQSISTLPFRSTEILSQTGTLTVVYLVWTVARLVEAATSV